MSTIILIICGAIILLFILSYFLPIGTVNDAYGSAHFTKNKSLRVGNKGLNIDGFRSLTNNASFRHSMVIAPTGAEKTQRFVLNNILSLDGSIIITDPKNGELRDLCAPYLEQKGFKVMVLDIGDVTQSLRYNILQRVNTESEIQELATTFFDMANDGGKTEAVWKNGAVNLIKILILCIKNIPDTRYHTVTVLIQLLTLVENGTDQIAKFVDSHAPDQTTKDRFQSFSSQDLKVKMGQLSSALTSMTAFDTKEMKLLGASDDFDFREFRSQKVALFLNMPVGKAGQFTTFVSIFYTQLLNFLLSESVKPTDQSIYFILEEFGNLKRIPKFENIIALIRSQRVSLSIILQNLSQLDMVYSTHTANTIIANTASVIIYGGIRDERTLMFIQRLLGKTTKTMFRPASVGIQYTQRNLMNVDEIRTLPSSQGLFIFGNKYAQKIFPTALYKNKKLMRKCGIASRDGKLVAIESFQQSIKNPENDILLFPVDRSVIDQETMGLQRRLEELLGKE